MDNLNWLLQGLEQAATPMNLLYAVIGVLLGTAVGVLPGIGPAMTVALLLPVTYQHGRYQIPVIPVLIIVGWQGISRAAAGAASPVLRVLTRAWAAAAVVVSFAFVVIGARAYAGDVAVIETEMVESIPEKVRNRLLDQIPLRRFGSAEEVARAVVYLVSSDGDYITGAEVSINGGLLM